MFIVIKYWLYTPCYAVYPMCLLLSYPCITPPVLFLPIPNHSFIVCICVWFFLVVYTSCLYFLDSIYKWYHTVFVFLWLISLSIMPSKSIHVATNGKMSFFVCLSSIPLYVWVLVTQSCLTLCNPVDCSWPGSSVLVILQARILEA